MLECLPCCKKKKMQPAAPNASAKKKPASDDDLLEVEMLADQQPQLPRGTTATSDTDDGLEPTAAKTTTAAALNVWSDDDESAYNDLLATFAADGYLEPVLHEAVSLDVKFLSPPPAMLAVELCVNMANLAAAAIASNADPAVETSWEALGAVYFTGVNSCAMTNLLLNASLADLYHRRFAFLRRNVFLLVTVLLYAPALIANIVPGLFVFAVATAPCVALGILWTVVVRKIDSLCAADAFKTHALLRLAYRVVVSLAAHFAVQIAYNAMLLWAPGRAGYMESLAVDYRARSIPCQLDMLTDSVSSLQTVTALLLP